MPEEMSKELSQAYNPLYQEGRSQGEPSAFEKSQVQKALEEAKGISGEKTAAPAFKFYPGGEQERVLAPLPETPEERARLTREGIVHEVRGGAINRDQAERDIFGVQLAFSERWTNLHGMDRIIRANPLQGISRDFTPSEAFSEITETGFSDPTAWTHTSLAIETSPNRIFRIGAKAGLVNAIYIDHWMKSSRIDYVAQQLMGEHGLRPQGIAQWLVADSETGRALRLLFIAAGYEVADAVDASGRPVRDAIPGMGTDRILAGTSHRFSDVGLGEIEGRRADGSRWKISLDITSQEIKKYLEAIRRGVRLESGETTDPGLVRVAYTFFRALGFPHENDKFATDLISKNALMPDRRREVILRQYRGVNSISQQTLRRMINRGDIDSAELVPFIERRGFSDPDTGRTLAEVLRTEGILGFARSLNKLPAIHIAREWEDTRRMLDLMDRVSDIRAGTGGASTVEAANRMKALVGLDDFNILFAKRKLGQETFNRLTSPGRISDKPSAGKLGPLDQMKLGWKTLKADVGSFRRSPTPVRGEGYEHEGLDESDFN